MSTPAPDMNSLTQPMWALSRPYPSIDMLHSFSSRMAVLIHFNFGADEEKQVLNACNSAFQSIACFSLDCQRLS